MQRTVIVLGASGFIGSAVMQALSENGAWRGVAASRGGQGLRLDATDAAAVRAAVREADAVVNCIAGDERMMVRATEALCGASPKRLVHLSSMAVYGAAEGMVRETDPPVPPLSGYGQAKLACERLVRDAASEAVVLRPTCVFGPGSAQWTTRIARLLQARRLGDLGAAGDGRANLAFIEDVANCVVAALDGPAGVFNVNSTCELTWNQFLLRFARSLGAVPVRRLHPRRLQLETKVLAIPRRLGSKLVKGAVTEAITPSLAALMGQDIRVDASAAQAALALRPTPLDRMIDAAVAWLKAVSPGAAWDRATVRA